jgi:sugar lactone lactonase YvrE
MKNIMNTTPLPFCPRQALKAIFLCCIIAGSTASALAQSGVISSDSLTLFQPRDVGTTSDVKTVRVRLNYPRALSSIAVAPGFTDFSLGAISGCVVDGHTINPALTVCEVPVTFQPKYPGLRTAPLLVTDNTGQKYPLALMGTGLAPQAALTPGIITVVAGSGYEWPQFGGDGGPATDAELSYPGCIAADAAGNYYIADVNNGRIRKVDFNGIITTVAGNGGYNYQDNVPATDVGVLVPQCIAVDEEGNFYFPSDYSSLRKVDANGIITTISTEINQPMGLVADQAGNLYIADTANERVLKIDVSGTTTVIAGIGTGGYSGDGGPAIDAELANPMGLAIDGSGNLFVADFDNKLIRKIDTNGVITTVAGNMSPGFRGDGGPAVLAHLFAPIGVAVDAAGNLYITEKTTYEAEGSIRRVDTNGTITTVAGNGPPDYNTTNGSPANLARFNPAGIAIDSAGNIIFSDVDSNRVLKVDVSRSAEIFSQRAVGTTSSARRVVLTNIGNQHLDLGTLNTTGAFDFLSSSDPSYCSSTPEIGLGFSCALPITFTPTDAGPFTGTATVTDNSLNQPGTTQSISLSGTGVNP